jgi:hypothetical protein
MTAAPRHEWNAAAGSHHEFVVYRLVQMWRGHYSCISFNFVIYSQVEPFIIITALPARLPGSSGCCWSRTLRSAFPLTGTVMCMGVAANSILMVSFRERLREGLLWEAARTLAGCSYASRADDCARHDRWHGALSLGFGRGGNRIPAARVIGGLVIATQLCSLCPASSVIHRHYKPGTRLRHRRC